MSIKLDKNKKKYIFIYQEETDGNIKDKILTKKEILNIIQKKRISDSDFTIIDGNIIKTFDNKFIETSLKENV